MSGLNAITLPHKYRAWKTAVARSAGNNNAQRFRVDLALLQRTHDGGLRGRVLRSPMSLKTLKLARCSSIVRPSGTEPAIRVTGEGGDKILVGQAVYDVGEALTLVAA